MEVGVLKVLRKEYKDKIDSIVSKSGRPDVIHSEVDMLLLNRDYDTRNLIENDSLRGYLSIGNYFELRNLIRIVISIDIMISDHTNNKGRKEA